jgi:hypothetical protein
MPTHEQDPAEERIEVLDEDEAETPWRRRR